MLTKQQVDELEEAMTAMKGVPTCVELDLARTRCALEQLKYSDARVVSRSHDGETRHELTVEEGELLDDIIDSARTLAAARAAGKDAQSVALALLLKLAREAQQQSERDEARTPTPAPAATAAATEAEAVDTEDRADRVLQLTWCSNCDPAGNAKFAAMHEESRCPCPCHR